MITAIATFLSGTGAALIACALMPVLLSRKGPTWRNDLGLLIVLLAIWLGVTVVAPGALCASIALLFFSGFWIGMFLVAQLARQPSA